ncbi:hypothetical protein T484DRAFT_1755266 [Baffinella frigidus]|nr:hypothetical protein T484DRAFT_1755266 [Cryptophyta sp. CCMP2293]
MSSFATASITAIERAPVSTTTAVAMFRVPAAATLVNTAPPAALVNRAPPAALVNRAPPATLVNTSSQTDIPSQIHPAVVDTTWGRVIRPQTPTNGPAVQKKAIQVVFNASTFKSHSGGKATDGHNGGGKATDGHNGGGKATDGHNGGGNATDGHKEHVEYTSEEEEVNILVECVRGAQKGSDAANKFWKDLEAVFGTRFQDAADRNAEGMSSGAKCKLAILEDALKLLTTTRCCDGNKFIVEVVKIPGEITSGAWNFFRPERAFKVHDNLFFNLFMRRLQKYHQWFPRNKNPNTSTKAITEMFDLVGLGPHPDSGRQSGHKGGYRGPKTTDPNTGVNSGGRDGCYFNEYMYSQDRQDTAVKRCTHYKGAPGQKPKPGVRARNGVALAKEAKAKQAVENMAHIRAALILAACGAGV